MIARRSWTNVSLSKAAEQAEATSGWRQKLPNQATEVAVAESRVTRENRSHLKATCKTSFQRSVLGRGQRWCYT